ncbi:hypothetical protein BY996DRAFT_4603546, partial [Phakopsora pachyrhizi]
EHLFELLPIMLKQRPKVPNISKVPEAFVPIITLKLSGIKVDLLFAQLALPSIPDTLELWNDSLLKSQNNQCVQSQGGFRATDKILQLVPDIAVFRDSLRAIKSI